MNKRVLIVALVALLLTLHPWTWAQHGTRQIIVPAIAYVVVCVIVYVMAIRLGDVSSPFRRPQRRPRLESRKAGDVTRAAEDLLRRSRRR